MTIQACQTRTQDVFYAAQDTRGRLRIGPRTPLGNLESGPGPPLDRPGKPGIGPGTTFWNLGSLESGPGPSSGAWEAWNRAQDSSWKPGKPESGPGPPSGKPRRPESEPGTTSSGGLGAWNRARDHLFGKPGKPESGPGTTSSGSLGSQNRAREAQNDQECQESGPGSPGRTRN